MKRYQRQLLGLFVLLVFVGYFLFNRSVLDSLRDVSPGYGLGIMVAYLGIMYTNGLFIKYIIRAFDKHISAWESVRVALISSLGNFFAASGAGLGFRAVYLKRKHNLAYSDYLSTLYGNYLLLFMICGLAGLVSLATVKHQAGLQFGGVLLFLIA
jgi:uncharacterized membrane protein YbhN (UPF0104 family)